MKANKKALAILMAALMMMALMVPALATGAGTSTTTEKALQITKTLKIGQGIAIPNETFSFKFKEAEFSDVRDILGEDDSGAYLDPRTSTTQQQIDYPSLPQMSVTYSSDSRSDAESTDTEVTYMAAVPVHDTAAAGDGKSLDLSKIAWPRPGLFIYEVTEIEPDNKTDGMTYDRQKYFLKVYVKENETTNEKYVDQFFVLGNIGGTWTKIDPAPTDVKEITNTEDRCDDYKGNPFCFTNVYKKMVERHPQDTVAGDTALPNDATHSEYAFQLTKNVAGSFTSTNTNDSFNFDVTVSLPATCDPANDLKVDDGKWPKVRVNGYSAREIVNNQTYLTDAERTALAAASDTSTVEVRMPLSTTDITMTIALRAGEQFQIDKLPEGTIVKVTEYPIPGMAYTPSYLGQWGLNPTSYADNAAKSSSLGTRDIVVGDHGAYVHYTNTINDNDISVTGIVINNLPYILMIVIAVVGIGFYMVSKKRKGA